MVLPILYPLSTNLAITASNNWSLLDTCLPIIRGTKIAPACNTSPPRDN